MAFINVNYKTTAVEDKNVTITFKKTEAASTDNQSKNGSNCFDYDGEYFD